MEAMEHQTPFPTSTTCGLRFMFHMGSSFRGAKGEMWCGGKCGAEGEMWCGGRCGAEGEMWCGAEGEMWCGGRCGAKGEMWCSGRCGVVGGVVWWEVWCRG